MHFILALSPRFFGALSLATFPPETLFPLSGFLRVILQLTPLVIRLQIFMFAFLFALLCSPETLWPILSRLLRERFANLTLTLHNLPLPSSSRL